MKLKVSKIIQNIKPYVPGKPVEEVKRELGLRKVIKLASNENPYGPSPKAVKAISRGAANAARYPDAGCYYLRDELSRRLKVKPNQLIFGNGSDEVIVLAIKALVNKGDEVVIAKPSFLIYDIASRIAGAKVKAVPLKNFHYDLKGMKRAVTRKTKIVFLGNPDNPSGKYFTADDIKGFLKGLRKDILVFIDEAYFEYVTAKDYVDSLAILRKHDNVLVTRTFSKMYALAGLRVGYGIGHPKLIDWLNRIREPFNVNSLAQAAAVAALKDGKYYKALSKKIERQRAYLYKNLQRMSLSYVDSSTNFILIKLPKSGSVISARLLKKGIIVRDMTFWGMNEYIRVSIGTQTENRKFIQVLEEVL